MAARSDEINFDFEIIKSFRKIVIIINLFLNV
jgi:hypothetical protein